MASLQDRLISAFASGRFTDLIVHCKDEVHRAHKLVLCTQCPFFDKACTSGFKEAQNDTIVLDDDNPEAVGAMIEFFYRHDYETPIVSCNVPDMLQHVEIYAIAAKYEIPGLQKLATERFKAVAETEWKNDEFIAAIPLIYESTFHSDRGLRDIVIALTATHSKKLLKNGGGAFMAMMEEVGAFGADLFKYMALDRPKKSEDNPMRRKRAKGNAGGPNIADYRADVELRCPGCGFFGCIC